MAPKVLLVPLDFASLPNGTLPRKEIPMTISPENDKALEEKEPSMEETKQYEESKSREALNKFMDVQHAMQIGRAHV